MRAADSEGLWNKVPSASSGQSGSDLQYMSEGIMDSPGRVDRAELNVFFWEGVAGRIFCVEHGPPAGIDTKGVVVLMPPFAEEMNKSRRLISMQARELARIGFRTIVPDLFGTGDSEGEFGDASWNIWVQDLQSLAIWVGDSFRSRVTLWGVRFGSLLIPPVLERILDKTDRLILWNPMNDGAQFSRDLFRLARAGNLVGTHEGKPGEKRGGTRLETEKWEIGGYEIPRNLVEAAEQIKLEALGNVGIETLWAEVVRSTGLPPPKRTREVLEALSDSSMAISHIRIEGDLYWGTSEITVIPKLVRETTDWMG
jgi:exosortase A-associated hydrolase 2